MGPHRVSVVVLAADGHQDLADVDARRGALGLAEGATHARLQPIRPGAREHLVDAQHVEGVDLRPQHASARQQQAGVEMHPAQVNQPQ